MAKNIQMYTPGWVQFFSTKYSTKYTKLYICIPDTAIFSVMLCLLAVRRRGAKLYFNYQDRNIILN